MFILRYIRTCLHIASLFYPSVLSGFHMTVIDAFHHAKKTPQLSKAQSDRLKPPLKAHNTSSLKPPYWIGHHPSTTADQKGWCSHTFRWVDGLGVTPKQSRAAGARIRLCSCVGSRMICDTDMFCFFFSLLHPVFQNISVKGTKQKAWDLWWQFWSLHTRPHFKILLFYFSPQWMISE